MKGDPMMDGGELSNDVETAVSSAKSGGNPLSDTVRAPMEQSFNADFSSVKVHTGGESDNLNRSLNARAFTSGSDIFFRNGEYNPGSSGGQELLAHELTHTIQQGSAMQRKAQSNSTINQTKGVFFQRQSDNAVQRRQQNTIAHTIQTSTPWRIQALTQGGQTSDNNEDMEIAEPEVAPDLKDSTPDKHVITLSVHRSNQDYENYQKARWWLKQFNQMRSEVGITYQKPRLPKIMRSGDQKDAPPQYTTIMQKWTSQEMKMKAAFDALIARPTEDLPDLDEAEDIVDDLISNRGGGTGHTWVKFQTYVGDEMRSIDSFGFMASGTMAPTHPSKPVPGAVAHPDTSYDDGGMDGEEAFADYTVEEKKYNKAYQRGLDIEQSPPPYTTFDYNCTKFARELAKTADISFPGPMNVIPRIGKWYKTYNPNSLFAALTKKQKSLDTYNSASEAQERLVEKLENAPNLGLQEMQGRFETALGHGGQQQTREPSGSFGDINDFLDNSPVSLDFMGNNDEVVDTNMNTETPQTREPSGSFGDLDDLFDDNSMELDFMNKGDEVVDTNIDTETPQTREPSGSFGDLDDLFDDNEMGMDFMGKTDEKEDEL